MTLRPCADCGDAADGTRCEPCRLARARTRSRHQPRPRRAQVGYDSAWARLSRSTRTAQPWCGCCGAVDDLTLDHVVPLADGGPRRPDVTGLDVLCRRCNSSKGSRTVTEGGGSPVTEALATHVSRQSFRQSPPSTTEGGDRR